METIMKELSWFLENSGMVIAVATAMIAVPAVIRTKLKNTANSPWGLVLFTILDTLAMNWGEARNANQTDPVTGAKPVPTPTELLEDDSEPEVEAAPKV